MSATKSSQNILWCSIVVNSLIIVNYLLWIYFPPNALLAIILTTFILLALPIAIIIVDRSRYIGSISLVLFFVFSGLLITLYSGSPDWDTRSIWLLHAKQIYFDNHLYAPLDPYVSAPRDYPLMVPALMATLVKIVGIWNEAYPKSAIIFFYIAPLLLYAAIYRSFAYFGIFIIGLTHIGSIYLFNGYMDVVQALYLCAIMVMLNNIPSSSWQNENQTKIINVVALCLFIVIALQIKNEGAVGVLCICIGAFLSIQLRRYQYFFAVVLAAGFYIYYWKVPLANAHIVSDLFLPDAAARGLSRASSVHNWVLLIKALISQSGFWYACLGLCLYLDRVRLDRNKLVLSFVILYTLALICVYLFTGAPFPWQLDVSIARTMIPINLCILTYCLCFIQDHEAHLVKFMIVWFNRISRAMRVLITIFIFSIASTYFWHNFLASPYAKDRLMTFCKGCNGVQYLENVGTSKSLGWSHPENWGTWMLGSKAEINLPMPRLHSPKEITLRAQPYLPRGVQEQQFDIAVNGMRMGTYRLNTGNSNDIHIAFPPEITLIERLTGRYLRIQFTANSPTSPRQFCQNDDDRDLSIGLISIAIH